MLNMNVALEMVFRSFLGMSNRNEISSFRPHILKFS